MCRALNQRSKGVWLLHVDESNFGSRQRRFRGKAIRVSHAGDDWHRRGTQEAQNITARPPACTDGRIESDARCTHCAMIVRLWRVRDPMRPRPIDVGVAGDAPLRAAMRTCRQSGKSNLSREIPLLSRGLSSTQRRHTLAISSNVRSLETPRKRNRAALGRIRVCPTVVAPRLEGDLRCLANTVIAFASSGNTSLAVIALQFFFFGPRQSGFCFYADR